MAKSKSIVLRKTRHAKVAKNAVSKPFPPGHWAYGMGLVTTTEKANPQPPKK